MQQLPYNTYTTNLELMSFKLASELASQGVLPSDWSKILTFNVSMCDTTIYYNISFCFFYIVHCNSNTLLI